MDTHILKMISGLIVVMLITPFHEFAHAFAANKLGDTTAEEQGRLTVNPLAHLDPIGSLCIILCGFGWAKPVPVNPLRFKPVRTEYVTTKSGKQKLKKKGISMRAGMAITAAAGPIANIIAAFITVIIYRIIHSVVIFRTDDYYSFAYSGLPEKMMFVLYILYFIAVININLAVFNLIPIPPLDGSKILGFLLGRNFEAWLYKNERNLSLALMIVVAASSISSTLSNIVFAPLSWLSNVIFDFLMLATNWIPPLVDMII